MARIHATSIVSVVTILLALQTSDALAANLQESVRQAVTSHPQIAAGKAARAAADSTFKEQRAGYFPTVSVNARAGHVDANDDTTRGFTGGNATSWLGEGGVTLTQPLFAGFSVLNSTKAAEERREAAEFELGGTAEDIALRAARAHLNLMRTRELLAQATEYRGSIEKRRDSVALMLTEGAGSEAELLQAEDVLMVARATNLGYEDAFGQAEADYIEAVGTPATGELSFGDAAWESLLPSNEADALRVAATDNPRLKAADTLREALGHEREAEAGALYPRVNAEMSYLQRDQDDELSGESANGQAMLTMSWNFSTGGAQFARIERGRHIEKEATARRADILRGIEKDVRQKMTAMTLVNKQFDVFVERETAAQKILDNFVVQFEGGQQTNLALLQAEARLFDAKAARIDAFYRKTLARFELLAAMGRLRGAFGVGDVLPARTAQK